MFGGKTYVASRDRSRLSTQLEIVRNEMLDGKWKTLNQLLLMVPRATTASISARVRDLRKEKFGGYTVERRNAGDGIHEYRIVTGS